MNYSLLSIRLHATLPTRIILLFFNHPKIIVKKLELSFYGFHLPPFPSSLLDPVVPLQRSMLDTWYPLIILYNNKFTIQSALEFRHSSLKLIFWRRHVLSREDNPLVRLFHSGQHLQITELQAEIITSVKILNNKAISVNHWSLPFQVRPPGTGFLRCKVFIKKTHINFLLRFESASHVRFVRTANLYLGSSA